MMGPRQQLLVNYARAVLEVRQKQYDRRAQLLRNDSVAKEEVEEALLKLLEAQLNLGLAELEGSE